MEEKAPEVESEEQRRGYGVLIAAALGLGVVLLIVFFTGRAQQLLGKAILLVSPEDEGSLLHGQFYALYFSQEPVYVPYGVCLQNGTSVYSWDENTNMAIYEGSEEYESGVAMYALFGVMRESEIEALAFAEGTQFFIRWGTQGAELWTTADIEVINCPPCQ